MKSRCKGILPIFLSILLIVLLPKEGFALQSGGVEIGDLKTGSVAGRPFSKLNVDMEFTAMKVGGFKVWYPPYASINLKSRFRAPIVLKVTNALDQEHGFYMSADSSFAGPTSLLLRLTLKPGETKYIGIPTHDLTYVTAGTLLEFNCHLHALHKGGQLQILK